MTNLFYENRPDKRGYIESIRRTHAAGFNVMDFCMCPMQREDTELNGDDWESLAYDIADEAAKLGVTFAQSHLPYPKMVTRRRRATDEGCERNERFEELTRRAVRISGMLGVKWAVVHPVMREANCCTDTEDDIAYNHEIYDRYLELAAPLGVGLAFENMGDPDGKRRFGSVPAELLGLINSYGENPYVGICWDFGHANRMFYDQTKQLAAVLPHLKATHVDDNIGTEDLHTIPFLGTIDWQRLMPMLAKGGYNGVFNYEIKFTSKFPEPLKDESAVFARHIGEYLISLSKQ